MAVLIVAGLLVGLGSRLGGGCTSGHGICGNARLSPRSITATLLFMAAGFAVVFIAGSFGILTMRALSLSSPACSSAPA